MAFILEKFYRDPLYRNSLMLILNVGSNAFFGFLFWFLAARLISPAAIGLATATISLAALITSLSGLGMASGLIRFLPGDQNKNRLFNSVLIINVAFAALLCLLAFLGIGLAYPSLSFLESGIFPFLFIIYVLAISIFSVQNFTLIALRRADFSFLQNFILVLRLPIFLLISFLGLAGIFYSFSLAYAAAILFGTWVLYRYGIRFIRQFDYGSIKKIMAYSLGSYTAQQLINSPGLVMPIVIVSLLGPASNAYFYIAYSIASFLFMIPNGISMSLFVEGSHDLPLRKTTMKASKLLILSLLPAFLLIYLFSYQILSVFNIEYAEKSLGLLRLFALSSLFSSVISVYTSILMVNKNMKLVNILYGLYSGMIVLLGYVLIIAYGLIGLGYAWTLSSAALCAIILVLNGIAYLRPAYQHMVQP